MIPQRRELLNHDRPQFIDDFIYRPPYELIDRALQTNQNGFDNTIGTAFLFKNIPIDFIDDPEEKEYVNSIISKYADRANTISQQMLSNPSNWKKYNLDLNNLKNELANDYKTGDIYRIQQNKENLENHINSLSTTVKDANMNMALRNKALQDWKNSGRSKGGAIYQNTPGYDQRDLMKEFAEMVSNLPTDKTEQIQSLLSGMVARGEIYGVNEGKKGLYGYIRDIKGITETNAHKIAGLIDGFFNDPSRKGLLQQMTDLGMGNYITDGNVNLSALKDVIQGGASYAKTNHTYSDEFRSNPVDIEAMRQARQARQATAQKERELSLNNYGFSVPENRMGDDYQTYIAESLNGYVKADGTYQKGLFESLYGSRAEYMKQKLKGKSTEELIHYFKKSASFNKNKTIANRGLKLIKQFENNEKKMRNAGVASLASQIMEENPNLTSNQALEASIEMRDKYATISNQEGELIPLSFGHEATTINRMNSPANMYEIINGRKVARAGSYAINKQTSLVEKVPLNTSQEDRKNKYYPIIKAEYMANTAEFIYTRRGSSKDKLGTHGVKFTITDDSNEEQTFFDRGTAKVYDGDYSVYTHLRYDDIGKTNYRRWDDEIDEEKAKEKAEKIRYNMAVQNSLPNVKNYVQSDNRRVNFSPISRKEMYENNLKTLRYWDENRGNFIGSENDIRALKTRVLTATENINKRKKELDKNYRSWLRDSNLQDTPSTKNYFKQELSKTNPDLATIMDFTINTNVDIEPFK